MLGFSRLRRILLRREPAPAPGWPSGHFYSPLPSLDQISHDAERIFDVSRDGILGLDLNEIEQISNFESMSLFYNDQPFSVSKKSGWIYYAENDYYNLAEAIILQAMMRLVRPKRIIEIGSGFSSGAMIDVNKWAFDNNINLTFIEPYPDRLNDLVTSISKNSFRLINNRVQEVDSDIFMELDDGDMLFIDSSHVSKIDSDVNHIFFRILPIIKSGVYIHFHDIYYPFEYPKNWVMQGRAWNEAYILRAFLQYNCMFQIFFFNSFFGLFHREIMQERMPLCAPSPGSSLWLRKTPVADGGRRTAPLS
jgi:predicted O-methyltransferase YrrM